jgi:hypothetical protein
MSPELILGLLVAVPVVLLTVLGINAVLVFLSVCLGNLLIQFVAPDASDLLGVVSSSKMANLNNTSSSTIKLVLLLIPVVLTTIFMIRTVRGKGRLALNVLPAFGVGFLLALLVVPLLPGGVHHDIVHSSIWQQFIKLEDIVIGASALLCMFVLWIQRPKTGEGKHGKHGV